MGKDIKPSIIDKPITTADIGATVLDIMDITDKIGLGRSALTNEKVADNVDEMNILVGQTWRNTITNYIGDHSVARVIQTAGELVYYKEQPYHIPFVLNIYTNKNYVAHGFAKNDKIVLPDVNSSAFVWIDKCKNIQPISKKHLEWENCVASGAFGNNNLKITPLTKSAFTNEQLQNLLIGYRNEKLAKEQKNALQQIK